MLDAAFYGIGNSAQRAAIRDDRAVQARAIHYGTGRDEETALVVAGVTAFRVGPIAWRQLTTAAHVWARRILELYILCIVIGVALNRYVMQEALGDLCCRRLAVCSCTLP